MSHSRNPIAAVVLSLLLPGLGHLYAGSPKLARNRFLLAIGAGVIGQALLLTYVLGRASFPVTIFLVLGAYAFVTFDAAKAAERAPLDYTPRRFNRWYVYVAVFAAAVVFTQLERAAVRVFVQSYRILSDNMEPTLLIGDFIVVSKKWGDLSNLQHGSIVMHELTDVPGIEAIKRVAGLPGDTLAMIEDVLYLNGVPLEEPYVMHTQPGVDPTDPNMRSWQLPHYIGGDTTNYRPSLKNWGPLVVPSDSVFMLGDNRDYSYDSRHEGFVAADLISGRLAHIYYSYNQNSYMPLPFITAIRWNRLGRRPN